jgi:hypothetical protein
MCATPFASAQTGCCSKETLSVSKGELSWCVLISAEFVYEAVQFVFICEMISGDMGIEPAMVWVITSMVR